MCIRSWLSLQCTATGHTSGISSSAIAIHRMSCTVITVNLRRENGETRERREIKTNFSDHLKLFFHTEWGKSELQGGLPVHWRNDYVFLEEFDFFLRTMIRTFPITTVINVNFVWTNSSRSQGIINIGGEKYDIDCSTYFLLKFVNEKFPNASKWNYGIHFWCIKSFFFSHGRN